MVTGEGLLQLHICSWHGKDNGRHTLDSDCVLDNAVIRGNDDHDDPSAHSVPKIPRTAAQYIRDRRNIQGKGEVFGSLTAVNIGNVPLNLNLTLVAHQASTYLRFPLHEATSRI